MEGTEQICGPVSPTSGAHVVERPVGIRDVRLSGGPLARWQGVNRDVTFPLALARLESEGNLANLRLAAGEPAGDYRAPIFMDGAVHKMLEAAAWEVVREPNEKLEEFLTLTGELLARVQADDGYVNSYYQVVRPKERYSQLDRSHEIYLGGLLALAGVARLRGGGGAGVGVGAGAGALPIVARRFADHLVETFLPGDRPAFDGHPGAELAFVELYRLTGAVPYLRLASKMVEGRGHGRLGTAHGGRHYRQDHLPVREASTVVGHAVRAMYLEAGIVDVYLETGDRSLLDASVRRWDDLVACKMSLTGGIGSRHRGEAFGEGYELPPDRAYNESCAAFAAVFWNWRLLLATGDSRYADMIERLLYNAFAASTSLDGSRFFYVNPLQRREDHLEGDDPGRRCEWFACPCCPPNIMRLVSTLGHYVATTNDDGVLLHQYAPSEIRVPVRRAAPSGSVDQEVQAVLVVDTDYPWSGSVEIAVAHAPGGEWTLGLRIPAWCARARVFVDGEELAATVSDRGYVRLTRSWQTGDVVR
ncbi:MAG TPA: beta-L-arabinofuranosidase domain-containing protein, partial [Actinopolymorphaceae bacterium]|nr:beta-L-arabinofuranosidase domain-containing protein [Actinopolymorphaceae bacterium]